MVSERAGPKPEDDMPPQTTDAIDPTDNRGIPTLPVSIPTKSSSAGLCYPDDDDCGETGSSYGGPSETSTALSTPSEPTTSPTSTATTSPPSTASLQETSKTSTSPKTTARGTITTSIPTSRSISGILPATPSETRAGTNSTNPNPYYDDDGNSWTRLDHNAQRGIVAAVVIIVLLIAGFSYWFCCGGRLLRAKKQRRESGALRPSETTTQLNQTAQEMRDIGVGIGMDAPPKYEEAVPAQHHRLAGGIVGARNEEEDGMIADGKMPLSEIPFEDVVVDDHTSVSSSTAVSARDLMAHDGTGHGLGHINS